jgi:hypothetical protein
MLRRSSIDFTRSIVSSKEIENFFAKIPIFLHEVKPCFMKGLKEWAPSGRSQHEKMFATHKPQYDL